MSTKDTASIILRDMMTGRFVNTAQFLPRIVDKQDATRFATRMDAGAAMLRLPLTVAAVAEEIEE